MFTYLPPFWIFFLGDLPLNLQPYRGDNQSEIFCLRKPLPCLSLSTLSKFCRMFRPPKRILLELVKRMTGCVAQPPWIPTTSPENVNFWYISYQRFISWPHKGCTELPALLHFRAQSSKKKRKKKSNCNHVLACPQGLLLIFWFFSRDSSKQQKDLIRYTGVRKVT